MMNNKDTENLIKQTLNSEKPDRRVLAAAKSVMMQKKSTAKRAWWYYAAAASSAFFMAFGIIAAVLSRLDLYTENYANNAGAQTHIIAADCWLIISILSISTAAITGIVLIIVKVKSTKRNK